MNSHSKLLETLYSRCEMLEQALAMSDESVDQGWIHSMTLLGVTTHYKVLEDNSLYLRLEGSKRDLPLFEQLAVVNEVDLFNTWMPFCSLSEVVSRIYHAEIVAYLKLQFPFLSRDFAMHCFGSDCLFENGSIVIIGVI